VNKRADLYHRGLWEAFMRVLTGLLVILVLVTLYLGLHPEVLGAIILNGPGVVAIPKLGPVPPQPVIAAPAGIPPGGYLALSGEFDGVSFACGFLLQLEDGRRVGLSTAHAAPAPPPGATAVFLDPEGGFAAHLNGQIGRGRTFRQDHFTADYALWSVANNVAPDRFLKPDPRGQAQPGEHILVFGRFSNGTGASKSWPGVVMKVTAEATWIQLDDFIHPYGFSGCPVVSQYTGRVVGMAVAGSRNAPTRMGVHPIGSLVEKAHAALGGD
jgi:hypothetical protein